MSWLAVVLAVSYCTAAVVLRRRGGVVRWRLVCFMAGCALLWVVSGSRLEMLSRSLFSAFMFQQLTLMIVVPPLLVLGAPIRLALRWPRRGLLGRVVRRTALGVMTSRMLRLAMHPLVTIGLFLLAYFGLYLSGAAGRILAAPVGDLALEVFFLAVGVLFAIPIFSSGRLPRAVTHPERALDLFAEMALHAFFGVLVMISTTVLVPAFAASSLALGVDPLADQAIAGGIAWSYGEAPAVLTLLFVMERWFRSDAVRSRRSATGADVQGETELVAYNAYLASLTTRRRPD